MNSIKSSSCIYCIYCITCKINQKMYVGKTISGIKKRWNRHCSDARLQRNNSFLGKAIRKHGESTFHISILEQCKTHDQLLQQEKYWIQHLDTYNLGYNLTEGGVGPFGHKQSKATKKKKSEKLRGRQFSKSHKQNISRAKIGKPNGKKGFKHTEETKEKIKQKRLTNPCSLIMLKALRRNAKKRMKSVAQINSSGEVINTFSSICAAAETLQIHATSISKCCKGKMKQTGNFCWKYVEDKHV